MNNQLHEILIGIYHVIIELVDKLTKASLGIKLENLALRNRFMGRLKIGK